MGMRERLEKAGILKHQVTVEEMEQANLKLRQLTAQFLRGEISIRSYRLQTDKLPKINLRQLAQELHYKG